MKITQYSNDEATYTFRVNLIDFPATRRKKPGVYQIDNVYIGASKSIIPRINSHLRAAVNETHDNSRLGTYLKDRISKNDVIDVKLLCDDPFKESNYIQALNPPLNGKEQHLLYHSHPKTKNK